MSVLGKVRFLSYPQTFTKLILVKNVNKVLAPTLFTLLMKKFIIRIKSSIVKGGKNVKTVKYL